MKIPRSADKEYMMKTVLVIDDNPDFRETVIDILFDCDFDVYEAACPQQAFEILMNEKVDVILCDLNMPFTIDENQKEFVAGNKVGSETIKELGWVFPETPIICISAEASWVLATVAKEIGDIPILRKPVSPKILVETIEKASKSRFTELSSASSLPTEH